MFIYILGFIFLMLGAYARVGSDLDNQKDHDLLVLKERCSDNNSFITPILGSLSELVYDPNFFYDGEDHGVLKLGVRDLTWDTFDWPVLGKYLVDQN